MITQSDLLVIGESLSDTVSLAADLDWVFPTPTDFTDKADFWACVNSLYDTAIEIDTELIRAAWIEYISFEDEADSPPHSPVKTLNYRITVFHEHSFERIDQTASPDAFLGKVLKSYQQHLNAVWSMIGEFQGGVPITGLTGYTLSEMGSLTQDDDTERNAPCEFIADGTVTGSQTRLIVPLTFQLEAC